MLVVRDKPPLFEDIVAVFPTAAKANVIFTWGDRIYAPGGATVTPALQAHEAVHGRRQLEHEGSTEGWWKRYLKDTEFRYAEELAAHRAEYAALCSWTRDRNARARALHDVAHRLSSDLYGRVVSYVQARRAVSA